MAIKSVNKKSDQVKHPGAKPGSIAAPVAVTRQVRGNRPIFKRGNGAVTIKHRELIGTFSNSSGLQVNNLFTGNLYKVNPSNASVFAWLQTIASNFDQYVFNALSLHYIPLCATTETGRVAIYFDKDSQDPEPADRVELANIRHITETAPWAEASLAIPVDNIKRFTNDSNTADPKLLDHGQVGIATYSGGSTNNVGDLFIEYTVTFYEPQPSSGLIQTVRTGTGATSFGPNFVDITDPNTTACNITFRSPGVYIVSHFQRATTFVGFNSLFGVNVTSNTFLQSGTTALTGIATVVVASSGGILQVVGSGLGTRTTHVARGRVQNVSTLL